MVANRANVCHLHACIAYVLMLPTCITTYVPHYLCVYAAGLPA
jgi:hypothetical protein